MRDIKFLLETKEGREFLMDLLEDTGYKGDPYAYGEHRDYACGKKSVGLDLFHMILQTDNSSYKIMLDEKNERDTKEALLNERDREQQDRELHGDFGDGDDGAGQSGGFYIPIDGKGGDKNYRG